MFRAAPTDFNFDISGHNWFSDEHYWQAANKDHENTEKDGFFKIDAGNTRNRKFQNNF